MSELEQAPGESPSPAAAETPMDALTADERLAIVARRLAEAEMELRFTREHLNLLQSTMGWKVATWMRRRFPARSARGRLVRAPVRVLRRSRSTARSLPPAPPPPLEVRAAANGQLETDVMADAFAPADVSPHGPTRVLVICPMPVRDRIAGPAIRSWGFARALARHCQVTVAVPNPDHPEGDGFRVVCHHDSAVVGKGLMRDHDVLLFQGFALAALPGIQNAAKFIVADLVDPFNLEDLHSHQAEPLEKRLHLNELEVRVLNQQLQAGDFFICGNERQRDYWLGALNANGRINPFNSDGDPTFRKLIDVVPFGVRDGVPQHRKQVAKGVLPGIGPNDKLVLWNGGMWEWFDPMTAIRAMHLLHQSRPDIKLLFLGVSSPDPSTPKMPIVARSMALSRELGVYENTVFFSSWVPYDEVQNYLLEADLGISLHKDHLETRYSIRTRLFDYIWARLPMVLAAGDTLAEKLATAQVASLVPIGDARALADAILRELDEPGGKDAFAARFEPLIEELKWETVSRPLVDFCRQPRRAPDYFLAHEAAFGGRVAAHH